METDVKQLKRGVRTNNLGFISRMNDRIPSTVEGILLDNLEWVRKLPEKDRPTKCVLVYLDDKEDGYEVNGFSSHMKPSERIALLRVASYWDERTLLGFND